MEWREVAVKVHQLNPQWNEHKRESYVKHAVRPVHRPWISPLCAMAESSLCFLIEPRQLDLACLLVAYQVDASR